MDELFFQGQAFHLRLLMGFVYLKGMERIGQISGHFGEKLLFFIPNVLSASRKERKGLEANMRAAVIEAYGRKAPPYFDKPIVIRDPRRLMKTLDETRVGSAHSSASAIKRWFGGR